MKYAHIIGEALRHPWAVLDSTYDSIVSVLARCESGERFTEEQIRAVVGEKTAHARPWVVDEGGKVFRERVVEREDGFEIVSAYQAASSGGARGKLIAVLPVYGVIAPKVASLDISEGGTGIDALTKQFRSALNNPDVKSIVMDFDSPGGSVYGVDELAAEIFAGRDQKKITAQVSPLCASAAYYLASQCSEIVIMPSGEAGSIGVRTMHQDLSKMLEARGVKITHISAGKYKTEGAFTEPLNDEAKAAMQARVNDYYDMFVKAVARGREVKASDVKNGFGEGRMLGAVEAKRQGMVDRIATLDETLSRLGASADSSRVQMSAATNDSKTATAETTKEVLMDPVVTTAAAAADTTAITANNARIASILAICAQFGMTDKASGFVRENKSLEAVQAEILGTLKDRAKPVATTPDLGPQVELSEKEQSQYSLLRGVRNLCARSGKQMANDSGNCFEFEVSDAIAKKLGRDTGGFFMPTNIRTAGRPMRSDFARQTYDAVLQGTTGQQPGSNVVATEILPTEFIELLRNMQVLTKLGVRKLTNLQGNLQLPKQTGAATLAWTGENPAAVTASDQTFTNVSLSPKTAMAQTVYSRQFVIQSSLDAEQLVREDLAAIFALGLDLAGLVGTGASNQPTGISATSGITLMNSGTNGGAATYNLFVDAQTALETNNIPIVRPGVCTTPGVKGKLRKIAKLANSITEAVWADDNTVGGYPAVASNQLPSNLTKGTGTSLHMAIVGDFAQALFAEWGAMEIIADPYTQANKNNIVLTANMLVDFAVRYAAAFSVFKDIDITL